MRGAWVLGLCLLGTGVTAAGETRKISYERFVDRLKGGWAGQMVGVSYGSVYEFQALGQTIDAPLRPWKPEYVENSLGQDDIYVEMTFLKTLGIHGVGATSEQAGRDFRDSTYDLWHANMAARTNLRAGLLPPETGHPRYNPHSDDIDFQIEADLFGLVAPGLPREAVRLAETFGCIMNHGDGLYGGYALAAMYAQAYLEDEPTPEAVERCVEAGLKSVPAESGYARVIRDVLATYRSHPDDWRKAWRLVEEKYGRDDRCPDGVDRPFNIDAKVNGAYVVIGLLYGRGDFARTLEISTRCGQDADCNPASAAGILGTLLGLSSIPAEYVEAIPALTGRRFAYTSFDYPGLVAACERVTLQVIERAGGRLEGSGATRVLVIPVQSAEPPGRLEQLSDFSPSELKAWAEEFEARRKQVEAKRGSR